MRKAKVLKRECPHCKKHENVIGYGSNNKKKKKYYCKECKKQFTYNPIRVKLEKNKIAVATLQKIGVPVEALMEAFKKSKSTINRWIVEKKEEADIQVVKKLNNDEVNKLLKRQISVHEKRFVVYYNEADYTFSKWEL